MIMTTPTTLKTSAEQRKVNGNNESKFNGKFSFWLTIGKWAIVGAFLVGGAWASSSFITSEHADKVFQKKETALTKEAALEKYMSKDDFKTYKEDNKEELEKIYRQLENINTKLDKLRP